MITVATLTQARGPSEARTLSISTGWLPTSHPCSRGHNSPKVVGQASQCQFLIVTVRGRERELEDGDCSLTYSCQLLWTKPRLGFYLRAHAKHRVA